MKRALFLGLALVLAAGLWFLAREGRGRDGGHLIRADRPALDTTRETVETLRRTRTADPLPGPAGTESAGRIGHAGTRVSAGPTGEDGPAARRFQGTVVAEEGRVAQARIRAYSSGKLIAETRTNKTGSFDLGVPVPLPDLVLRVDIPQHAFLERDLGPQQGSGTQSLGNLFLRKGFELAGVVEDGSGTPIPDAQVQVSTLRGHSIQVGIGETIRTNTKGRFRFALAPVGTVLLTARAEGFGERSIEHRNRPGAEARLVLTPGHELAVRTVDPRGMPIPGVRLTIRSEVRGDPPRNLTSDSDGRATFGYLNSTTWNLRSEKPGFKPTGMFRVEANGSEVTMRIVPWPGASGTIETVEGTPPPAGTRVFALPMSTRGDLMGRLTGGTEVAADGSFHILDMRPGDYRAIVRAPGYAETSSAPFRVTDVGDANIGTVRLNHGGDLELVLRSGGKPVAGVRAELSDRAPLPAQLFSPPIRKGKTLPSSDSEGRLLLKNLSPGTVWVLLRGDLISARAVGPYSVSSGSVGRPGPIDLEPGSPIRGTVQDATGAPVLGARIHITGTRAGVPFLITDIDGTFETPPLPAGLYSVETNALVGGRPVSAPGTRVRLDGKNPGTARIVLEKEGP